MPGSHTHSKPNQRARALSLVTFDGNPLVFGSVGDGDDGFLEVGGGGAGRFIRLLLRRHTLLRIRFDTPVADVRLRGRRGLAADDGNDGVDGRERARGDGTLEFHGSIGTMSLLRFGSFPFLELLYRLQRKKGWRENYDRRGTKKSRADLFELSLFLL